MYKYELTIKNESNNTRSVQTIITNSSVKESPRIYNTIVRTTGCKPLTSSDLDALAIGVELELDTYEGSTVYTARVAKLTTTEPAAAAAAAEPSIKDQYEHFTTKWGSLFDKRLSLAIKSRKRAIEDCRESAELDNRNNSPQWVRWQEINREQLSFWLQLAGYHAAIVAIEEAQRPQKVIVKCWHVYKPDEYIVTVLIRNANGSYRDESLAQLLRYWKIETFIYQSEIDTMLAGKVKVFWGHSYRLKIIS